MVKNGLCDLWICKYYKTDSFRTLRNEFLSDILSYYNKNLDLTSIKKGKHGKPRITGDPFYFNLSHSGRYMALFVTNRGECGVDVQEVYPYKKYKSALVSILTDYEYSELEKRGDDLSFFALWSMKEAFIKGRGESIWFGRDYQMIDLYQSSLKDWVLFEGFFMKSLIIDNYPLSVSLKGEPLPIEIKEYKRNINIG